MRVSAPSFGFLVQTAHEGNQSLGLGLIFTTAGTSYPYSMKLEQSKLVSSADRFEVAIKVMDRPVVDPVSAKLAKVIGTMRKHWSVKPTLKGVVIEGDPEEWAAGIVKDDNLVREQLARDAQYLLKLRVMKQQERKQRVI